MTEHGLAEKIKQAIVNIFKKNNNEPLDKEELKQKIDEEIGNRETNSELSDNIIEQMMDRFALIEMPNNKLILND